MKTIAVSDLKAKLDAKEDIQVIDVREIHEVEAANIGATHIPMGEVTGRVDEIARDKQVVVHCRSGARSASVVQVLETKFGFDNLYNLQGGIMAWAAEIDQSLDVA